MHVLLWRNESFLCAYTLVACIFLLSASVCPATFLERPHTHSSQRLPLLGALVLLFALKDSLSERTLVTLTHKRCALRKLRRTRYNISPTSRNYVTFCAFEANCGAVRGIKLSTPVCALYVAGGRDAERNELTSAGVKSEKRVCEARARWA